MARVSEEEIQRLKSEISLERLVEAKGVKLRRHGKDLVGLCPLHDDHEPSLVITPDKNLWHCLGACQTGGSVIDWVMKAEGVSFRYAIELLRKGVPSLAVEAAGTTQKPAKRSTVQRLEVVGRTSIEDEELLRDVVDYYHATLKQSPEALAYLEKRGIRNDEAIEKFRLGFSNRTLGYHLPHKKLQAGMMLRTRYEELGIYRQSGHEHLNGSLVIPVFDEQGRVVEMYGRKITPKLKAGTPLHLYLPGPHRGVWNSSELGDATEIIFCESLIDALTFWCAGFRNVTAAYGVEGFTDDHREAFQRWAVERVLIAYDRDEAGERAAEKLAIELSAMGKEIFRIWFPKGQDANEFATKVRPSGKVLELLIRQAWWMAGPKTRAKRALPEDVIAAESAAPASTSEEAVTSSASAATAPATSESELTANQNGNVAARTATWPPEGERAPTATDAPPATSEEAPPATSENAPEREQEPEPAAGSESPSVLDPTPTSLPSLAAEPEKRGQASSAGDGELIFRFGDRRWRVRGLEKNTGPESLRVNMLCARDSGAFHVDTLELYSARQRAIFTKQGADELGLEEQVVKHELGILLLRLEEHQEAARQARAAERDAAPAMSEAERDQALALLSDPKLCDRILADFRRAGVVGEETNKLVGYLAATSRKLDEPLAIIIQSSSAAGKSSLMDAVLSLMPEEERVQYSAMTGQSLFYMGETNLSHKILAIVEEEGAERAAYALKLLQSEGQLTIASTGKDPATGRLVTEEYRVEGPVMIFLTTTAIEVDDELLNRCIVLTVDEGREQTRKIHELQREAETLEGLLAKHDRDRIRTLHQNAQRLLLPLAVVNPYARELRFLDHQTRTRRDHMKYLGLIRTISLLHQYQREVKEVEHRGEKIRYIEVSREDIALANRLAHEVLGRSLDELPPQTRRVLGLVAEMVAAEVLRLGIGRENFLFSRRELREHTGLSYEQLRVHLGRLVELEYLLVHRGGRGQSFCYELVYDGGGGGGERFVAGLVDPRELGERASATEATPTTSTLGGAAGEFGGRLGAHTGDKPGGYRGETGARNPRRNGSNVAPDASTGAETRLGTAATPAPPARSYAQSANGARAVR
jgi:DNA primase catalytic core